jgi:NAD(P)-dependent dehydrogenase (short-subunit alcohol dehydrogenase family)
MNHQNQEDRSPMITYKKLFSLKNKTIILAGGAGQIGFTFCQILLDAGADVIIADLDTNLAVEKIKIQIPKKNHHKIKVLQVDVSKKESVSSFFEIVSNEFEIIDGLINSFHYKGSTRKLNKSSKFFSNFEDYEESSWDKVHDINLKGSFLMSQCAIPLFNSTLGGVIVNISSTYGNVSANKNIYGKSGINSPVAYATSKAAIINLTRYMATHLAEKNIRVNCLSPGGVLNNQSKEFIKNYEYHTPMKRMAKSNEYQGAILFMMSEASSYMTGSNLIIDGGWTAW